MYITAVRPSVCVSGGSRVGGAISVFHRPGIAVKRSKHFAPADQQQQQLDKKNAVMRPGSLR